MMPTVLVTGGAGYIGSVLVARLAQDGYAVRVLDSMIFGDAGLAAVRDRCDIVSGDLMDRDCLARALGGIEAVVHLAAISNDSSGALDPEWTRQVNFEGTKLVVDLAKAAGVTRFVYASSSSVYGVQEQPDVSEDVPPNPLTIYSMTKAWSEEYVLAQASAEFAPVCLRSATVCGYSPRQRLDTVVNLFVCDAVTKGVITVNGGEQHRPLIHIADVCDCYRRLLSAPAALVAGGVFNAGCGNYTLMEIARLVRDHVGEHVTITRRPRTPQSRSYRITSTRIQETLGLVPQRSVHDAIVELEAAFENHWIPNPERAIYRNIDRLKELATA